MGCNQTCCYLDSRTIFDIVTKPINKYHYNASVIVYVQKLLRMNYDVQLCHSVKEENANAYFFV